MSNNPNWGGSRQGAGRPRQHATVPVHTFIGEGTKIEVFEVKPNVLFYHLEGQSLTTTDDLYLGTVNDLLRVLLEPLGCIVQGNRIVLNPALSL